MTKLSNYLQGIRVAVPESRQLDTMVQLLERRGATVFRVPLVAIHDAPDPRPVLAWIDRFIASPPDLFIILTGEGLRRLISLAGKHGRQEALVSALSGTRLLCRGPKPERALREIGLKADIQASAPTTEGVILTLEDLLLPEQRIAVQLYGEDQNLRLMDYLAGRKAIVDTVAPYIYADDAEEQRVIELLRLLEGNALDVIAFTSQPQVRRLLQVAAKYGREEALKQDLGRCCVAAVGPVVREQLACHGIKTDIMPGQAFFMKPLVTEIMRHFGRHPSTVEGVDSP